MLNTTPPVPELKREETGGFQATNVPPPTPATSPEVKAKKPRKPRVKSGNPPKENKWLTHVGAYRKSHPDLSFKDVLRAAKDTYVKAK